MSIPTIPVGWDASGKRVELPLDTVLNRHAWISGATGAGKSGAILSIILNVLANHSNYTVVVIDAKGELAADLITRFIPALSVCHPRLNPEAVTTIQPWSTRYAVPLNPLYRHAGIDPAIQARMVVGLVDTLGDGIGPRMTSILSAIIQALLPLNATLMDAYRMLLDADFARRVGERTPNAEAREYLLQHFPRERQDSKDALRSRLSLLLDLPAVRTALCADRSITGQDLLEESPLVVADIGTAPQGYRKLSSFFGAYIFSLISSAIFNRPVNATRRVIVVLDEAQVIIRFSAEEVEQVLAQARYRKVAMYLACQSIAQIEGVSTSLARMVLTNTHMHWLLQPEAQDLKHVIPLLPVTGRQIDPQLPDRTLSVEAERRMRAAALLGLPPRWGVVVNRAAGGTVTALRTLSVPYDRATTIASGLPAALFDRYAQGRSGVPVPELARQAARPCVEEGEGPREAVERPTRVAGPTPRRAPSTRAKLVLP